MLTIWSAIVYLRAAWPVLREQRQIGALAAPDPRAGQVDTRRTVRNMRGPDAGIAQLVEHDLAKVGVASSSLVSRSSLVQRSEIRVDPTSGQGRTTAFDRLVLLRSKVYAEAITKPRLAEVLFFPGTRLSSVPARELRATSPARWQSGHAAACKAAYAGSIPTLASKMQSSSVHECQRQPAY